MKWFYSKSWSRNRTGWK